MVEKNAQGEPDYEVGYKRPPKSTQFKPGQRANPRGRPRGSPNLKAIVERTLGKKISVRLGDKTSKKSVIEAMTETYALKAVQGDRLAAGVVINLASKTGVFGALSDEAQSAPPEDVVRAASSLRPSDMYVESVDPNFLSKDEQINLSQIAEQIDATGDVIDLRDEDIARLKQIVNKGRGKNVVPDVANDLDKAA